MRTPLEIAIYAAGGYTVVARKLGITQQAIGQWVKSNRVPATKCLAVESILGISRYELRPDVYGEAPSDAAAA